MKKNILHVIDALNYGGAQQLLLLTANNTSSEKFNVFVLVLQEDAVMLDNFERQGIDVVCLNKKRASITNILGFLSYIFFCILHIINLCRKKNIDIVHTHLSDAEFLGILAGSLARVSRIVTTVHYPDLLPQRTARSLRNRARVVLTKLLYTRVHSVVAVSNEVARNLRKVFHLAPDKIQVIPTRIDTRPFQRPSHASLSSIVHGLPDDAVVICNVARLMPPKGQTYLLQAVQILANRHPNLCLVMVGDGDLRGKLEALVQRLEIAAHVVFLGSRADIPEILSQTRIFVFSSLWEGISLALVEAMAAGKAIVATDIPGNRELIVHNHNGLLVPPGSAQALAEVVDLLLRHPDQAAELAANARKDALRNHDITLSIRQLEKVWGD